MLFGSFLLRWHFFLHLPGRGDLIDLLFVFIKSCDLTCSFVHIFALFLATLGALPHIFDLYLAATVDDDSWLIIV